MARPKRRAPRSRRRQDAVAEAPHRRRPSQPIAAPNPPAEPVTTDETRQPAFSITRIAHWIVLSWGWRRAAVAFVGGRAVGAGAGAVRRLAGAVSDLSDPGLAGRRRRRRPPRRRSRARPSPAGGSDSAISSPASIGSATPFWSTPRPSAGCCRLRSSRCRRSWPATPRLGLALARMLWTRGPTRLIALALTLTATEWLRGHLFSGFPWNALRLRADRTARACAGRGADRHLGPHVHRGRGVRKPGSTDRRPRRHAAALAAAALGFVLLAALAGYGAMRLVAHADRVCRRRAAADHAAQSASRTRNSTTAPNSG